VIPLKLDGSKAPAVAWDAYKTTIANDDTLHGWFSQGNHGIGIIGGAVSGNLERIDFDLPGSCKAWANLAKECGYGGIVDSLPLVRTPRSKQCYHLYYRCESPIEGNQPLARYVDSGGKVKVAIETRGEGGYTIAPGSPTGVHETGNPYHLVRGDLRAIPVISSDDREALLEVARSFNEYVPDQPTKTANRDARGHGGAPGDDYNTRGDWRQLLTGQGWSRVWSKGDVEYWRRPGKSQGVSATWNYAGSGLFYVFTSNALPFEPEQSYTPFGIYTTMLHGGDYKEAAKALSGEGYGSPAVRRNGSKSEEDDTPGSNEGFPLTDLGNAERLIASRGANLRYNVDSGQWLVWNEQRWKQDFTGEVDRLARQTIRGIADEIASIYVYMSNVADSNERERMRKRAEALSSHMKSSESRARLDAMIALARYCEGVPVTVSQLDSDAWLLNCRNGVVNLRTGKLRPHNPADLLTKLVPVDYDPAVTCPRWEQFLSEIFAGDAGLIAYIQRAIGYTFSGDTSEQVFFIAHGDGSNGKSTLITALREILCDYHRTTGADTLMAKRNTGVRDQEAIGRLMGARFVSAIETNIAQHLAEGLVKALVGQDCITGAFLQQASFEFVPQFKLWLACNHRPIITGDDHGIWRRIKLIPFAVQFNDPNEPTGPYKDGLLPDKLRMEYPGILRWIVTGCMSWQSQGLGRCAAVESATGEYKVDSDLLTSFIDECCVLSPEAQISSSDLYRAYTAWCDGNGIRAKCSNKTFTERLQKRGGLERVKTRAANVWVGIELNAETASTEAVFIDDEPDYSTCVEDVEGVEANPIDFSVQTFLHEQCKNPPHPPHSPQSSINNEESNSLTPIFGSENSGSDWDLLEPDNGETVNATTLPYICGNCKRAVELTVKSRNVYQYECPSCGYQGVLPDYDYKIWIERKEPTQ
jgi:putative DNA primase/helicase